MEQSYIPVNIEYDAKAIFDRLFVNPIKRQRGCQVDEILFIKKSLNIDLPIISILDFPLKPMSISNIHKDEILDRPETNLGFALNFPLYQCEQTYMKWYKELPGATTGLHYGGPSTGTPTPKLLPEDAECIDTLLLNSPHIVCVRDWHSIENNLSDVTSRIISIRFPKKLTYLDVLKYFTT